MMRLEFTYTQQDFDEMTSVAPTLRTFYRALGWVLFLAVAAALVYVLLKAGATRNASPAGGARWVGVVVPLAPWVLVFGFVWIFVFWQLRQSQRKVWKRWPWAQQPKVMEISEAGVKFSDALASTFRRWESFVALVETPSLFLLRQADGASLMVPKRAVSPGQLDALRELLVECTRAKGT